MSSTLLLLAHGVLGSTTAPRAPSGDDFSASKRPEQTSKESQQSPFSFVLEIIRLILVTL